MVSWFEYALLSAIFGAAVALSSRALMKNEPSHLGLALWMQYLPILFWLPLLASEKVQLPQTLSGWALPVIAGAVWAVQQIVAYKSHRFTPASVRAPVYETKLIWAAVMGFLVFGESVGFEKAAGVGLILAGGWLAARSKTKEKAVSFGVQLVATSAFLTALASVLDKAGLAHFSVTAYAVVLTMFSGLFVLLETIRRNEISSAVSFLRRNPRGIALASASGAFSYWFNVNALSIGEVSSVVPVVSLSLIFATLGGIVLLQERENIGRKVAASLLAFAGALVLKA